MKKKLKDEDPAEVRRKRNLLKVSSRKKRHAIERWRPYLAAVEAVSVDLPRCPQVVGWLVRITTLLVSL